MRKNAQNTCDRCDIVRDRKSLKIVAYVRNGCLTVLPKPKNIILEAMREHVESGEAPFVW